VSKELLDHLIVVNERHLKRLMDEYVYYYHEDRTHVGLEKQTPSGHETAMESDIGSRVISMSRLDGMHYRYDLVA
jgi:putative transposase